MAIDRYQLDNGFYPENPVSSPPEAGAHILYRELCGDRDQDGKPDAGAKVYWEPRDFGIPIKNQVGQIAVDDQGRRVIVDAFGDPIRYHADSAGKTPLRTHNPTFDLWSLSGAQAGSLAPKDVDRWITNWN